jgi:hypothetical protein
MNHKLLFIPVALAILLPAQAYASNSGRATNASNPACNCHGSLSAEVVTTITGPSTIVAGTTQNYTTSMTNALVGAGLNVALGGLAGASLGDIQANTRFITSPTSPAPYTGLNQITHTDANVDSVGVWSYNFTLTAPLTLGTIVLKSVMLAFDGFDDTDGDLIDNFTKDVQVVAVPEPSTILLLGTGMAGLAALGRRRRP